MIHHIYQVNLIVQIVIYHFSILKMKMKIILTQLILMKKLKNRKIFIKLNYKNLKYKKYSYYDKNKNNTIFSENYECIDNQNNENSPKELAIKDEITDKILNGSKSMFEKVLASNEKLPFPKVNFIKLQF